MTYEDINIKYTDKLLEAYQFSGSFPHEDLKQEKEIKLTEAEKKLYSDSGFEWFPTLTGFMIRNGYFYDDEQRHYYVITDRGNLARELGGHKKFREYRKREINILMHQNSINKGLLITALLAILSPFLMEYGKQRKWWFGESQEPPIFQIQNHVDVHIDSTTIKKDHNPNLKK